VHTSSCWPFVATSKQGETLQTRPGAEAKGTESTLARVITTMIERIQTAWAPVEEQAAVSNASKKGLEMRQLIRPGKSFAIILDHGYKRIFDDFTREESFAAKLRQQVNGTKSRADVSSNFVTLMDGNDGCSFHKDEKNCRWPSYDWTCCVATTVVSEKTGRLHWAVTNLNSRAACGRAMDAEIKFAVFKLGLETKMERIDSS
jgi:hypothetical protein